MATTVSYSLRLQARALVPLVSEKSISKWIVGTNSLREENEVRVLQYDPDQERLTSHTVYVHAAEIWDIAPCPSSEGTFVTVWSRAGVYGATLWTADQRDVLQQTAELPVHEVQGHPQVIRSAMWHQQQQDLLVTVDEGTLRKWSVGDQGVQPAAQASAGELLQLWSGSLHPSNPDVACTAGGNNVQVWDLRAMVKAGEVSGAHRMPTRDVSFASQQDHRIVSAGDDCKLRWWDLRALGGGGKAAEPLLEQGGHSHWVWRAKYNPQHDQLIASSSSDSLVNLYYAPQLAAMVGSDKRGSGHGGVVGSRDVLARTASTRIGGSDLDGRVHTYDEHDDSVYGLAWSSVDPWLLASMSYDGRVVLNKVPNQTKYKVLL